MSFAVVHMQKITRGGLRGIQSHNLREKASHTNPDIDYEKSKYNYDFTDRTDNLNRAVSDAIKLSYTGEKSIRKDAVVMCSFIVTSDTNFFKGLDDEQQRKFFEDSYIFFSKRYGIENIVNANIHMDEMTPHMHLGVVPMTDDGRLSAKSLFDKKELTSLQTDFARDVGEKYGLQRGIEGSEKKHLSEQRFKAEMAKQQKEQAEQDIVKMINTVKASQVKFAEIRERQKISEGKIDALEGHYRDKEENLAKAYEDKKNVLERKIEVLESEFKGKVLKADEIKKINPEKGMMGIKNISLEDIENLKKTSMSAIGEKFREAYKAKSSECEELRAENAELRAKIPPPEKTLDRYKEKIRLEQLEKAFAKLPANVQKELLSTQSQSRSIEHGR